MLAGALRRCDQRRANLPDAALMAAPTAAARARGLCAALRTRSQLSSTYKAASTNSTRLAAPRPPPLHKHNRLYSDLRRRPRRLPSFNTSCHLGFSAQRTLPWLACGARHREARARRNFAASAIQRSVPDDELTPRVDPHRGYASHLYAVGVRRRLHPCGLSWKGTV